jgi:hypothetical protein
MFWANGLNMAVYIRIGNIAYLEKNMGDGAVEKSIHE